MKIKALRAFLVSQGGKTERVEPGTVLEVDRFTGLTVVGCRKAELYVEPADQAELEAAEVPAAPRRGRPPKS